MPDHTVMDKASADTLRNFVAGGGTVIMTGYSAITDETNKVFDSPLPGRLSDVFGIRIAGFDRAGHPDRKGEIQPAQRTLVCEGETVSFTSDYVERIELHDAKCYAALDNGQCAVSTHVFGKGRAYYIASEANAELFSWLIGRIAEETGLTPPPCVPAGVQARRIAPGQIFYVNTTNKPVAVPLEKAGHGVLTEADYSGGMILAPYDGELLLCGEE